MEELVSGMALIRRGEYADLHFLIDTPYGLRAIDPDGCCIEFDINNYKMAYIPVNYDDPWVPKEGTEIIFQ